MIKNVLTIAGSDPSGGAGIQADLKTFSALGCYGMAAITALTAQSTQGVQGVHIPQAEFLKQQITALFDDVRIDGVKIGMAGNEDTVRVIAQILKEKKTSHIVLDPVMVATSGDPLLSNAAVEVLKHALLPLADVITPNIPEAEILLGQEYDGDLEKIAKQLLKLGSGAVLLKGGHLDGEASVDVIATEKGVFSMEARRIDTKNTHGTGCTLSSALACYLAKGLDVRDAAEAAKSYITDAIKASGQLDIGKGSGPVHHFHGVWDE